MEDKLHFITYGDEIYEESKQRIYNEALNTKWFHSIKCYGKYDLSIKFINEFKNILYMKKGGGYWIWKFDIILNRLNEINNGDFLIYADCGCTVNVNGIKRLKEYIEMIKNNKDKIISFQMGYPENNWTTNQIFNSFNIQENDSIKISGQYIGGIMIMQKCEAVINIFKDCLHKIRENPLIITDHYNKNQNQYFKENRHDQSILSVARKIHGSIVIPDETYSSDFSCEIIQKIPFLATRIK